jgi:hypothetical protein
MNLLSSSAHPARARPSAALGGLIPRERRANAGGPMSRSHSERISSTLLGRDDGAIRCPRSLRLGLTFPSRADPVKMMETLLHDSSYASAEDLRDEFALPPGRLICRPLDPAAPRLVVRGGDAREVLKQALLLGLCTAQLFDAGRPVLWTQTSLTRGLELFDPAGFYA